MLPSGQSGLVMAGRDCSASSGSSRSERIFYQAAEEICRGEVGADLVSIDSQEEAEILANIVLDM